VGEKAPRPGSGVVDAHVHAYPDFVAAAPAVWGRSQGEEGWTLCVAPEGKRSIQGWADADTLVGAMDKAGIETCVMLGWYWERQETCDLQNGWYASWIRKHPKRLKAFATVQPASGPRALDALNRALDLGLCGIGEILPQAQGFTLDDPVWLDVVAIAAQRNLPVTLHATDPLAPSAAGPKTPLEGYVRLARAFPKATFILAHWGGGLAFRGLPESGTLPANLYFDTAASPLLYEPGVFRKAIDLVGASRILYGSDYPLILNPRVARSAAFEPFLNEIAGAGLTPLERDLVMGSNARRLLPLDLAPGVKGV
jgi:predicted TIM-barrel fold metal-dependent hydrolase